MTDDQRTDRIRAIAMKALLLEPGEMFAVPVAEGGEDYVEQCAREIEDTIELEHRRSQMQDLLAHPDGVRVETLPRPGGGGTIIVGRE